MPSTGDHPQHLIHLHNWGILTALRCQKLRGEIAGMQVGMSVSGATALRRSGAGEGWAAVLPADGG